MRDLLRLLGACACAIMLLLLPLRPLDAQATGPAARSMAICDATPLGFRLLILEVQPSGRLRLNRHPVSLKELPAVLKAVLAASAGIRADQDGQRLSIFATKQATVGRVAEVIEALRQGVPDLQVALMKDGPKPTIYPYRCLVRPTAKP